MRAACVAGATTRAYSSLIEIFPRVNGVGPPVGHAGMMMYMQASFLGLPYVMLPVDSYSSAGDVDVPLELLRSAVIVALNATQTQ